MNPLATPRRSLPALLAAALAAALACLSPSARAQGEQTPHVEILPNGDLQLTSAYPGDKVTFTPDQLGTLLGQAWVAGGRKPFEGVDLTVATLQSGDEGPVSGAVLAWKDAFEELTGARVEVTQRAFGKLPDIVLSDQRQDVPRFDGFVVPMFLMGSLVKDGLVLPLNDLLTSRAFPSVMDTQDPDPTQWGLKGTLLPNLQRLYRWGSTWYAVPWDSDGLVLYYRRDVLENPAVQDRYQRATGKKLEVPRTLDELAREACYFDDTDPLRTGHVVQGTLQSAASGSQLYEIYRAMAAQYVAPESGGSASPGVLEFDPVTMDPRIDSPPMIRALETMNELYDCGDDTPNVLTLDDQVKRFGQGDAVFMIGFGDVGTRTESILISRPMVKGHLGVAPLPGSDQVYDREFRTWKKLDAVHRVGNVAGAQWSGMVSAKTEHPKAMYALLAFLASPPIHGWAVRWGFDGIDLGHRGDFLPPHGSARLSAYLDATFDEGDVRQLTDAYWTTFTGPVYDYLRVPGAWEYDAALRTALQHVVVRHDRPQDVLKGLADEWNRITEERGRYEQARWLRESLR